MTEATPERLVDPELHASGDPHATWRWMRTHAPVYWHEPSEFPEFWSITRREDVRAIYRNPNIFSSAHGVLLRPERHGIDPGGGLTLALSDPPRHTDLQSIVASWFTRRFTQQLEAGIRLEVRGLIKSAMDQGECDFTHDVAARVTHGAICRIMGVPEEDRDWLFFCSHEAFDAGRSLASHPEFMEYFANLMELRMAEPSDDLLSALVDGMVGGELLTEMEILLNCESLVGATENAGLSMAGGILAFVEHPDQWRRLQQDRSLMPTAIEEVLRWTSSAAHSMRVAAQPTVVRDQRIDAGDRVVLWIPSANHDESVFAHPECFDIGRRPNPQLAFGVGEHLCLGKILARTQLQVLFSELVDAVDRIEPSGAHVRVRSLAVRGPARLPVRLVPL